MSTFVAVCVERDLVQGQSRCVAVGGQPVIVAHSTDGWFAISALCSHAGQSMEGGRLRQGSIICPHHGARFDLRNGKALGPPAYASVATYPVRIRDGQVEVMVLT